MSDSFLHHLINPKSIAIVGASNNPMKMGTMHALSIINDGFAGKFYPVHPTEKTVLGYPAYAAPEDLPEAPDLALFVLPEQHLLPIFESFGRIGTKYAIVITAGFKETGDSGNEKEKNLKQIAQHYGMRFIGPNCMGIVNREISLNTTVMPILGKSGRLGMISQSGTYVAQTILYLQKRGIFFSKAVSLGNEADVNIIDVLEYLGDDDNTGAIAMYIESIRDVPRFLRVARSVTARKPVIAQYVGGSEAGARAGLSHTGAMAGKNHLYDGLFRQAGVIRVDSIEDLYLMGNGLANQPKIRGNRIGIITNSGGPGSAIADTCEKNGCIVPAFSKPLQSRIKPLIPPHAPSGNPVDLTFSLDMEVMANTINEQVMTSGEVDGVVIHGAMSTGFMRAVFPHVAKAVPGLTLEALIKDSTRDLSKTVNLPFVHQIPMTVSSFFDREDYYTQAYEDAGVPVFDSPEKAARGIAVMVKAARIMDRRRYSPPEMPPASDAALKIMAEAGKNGRKVLDEFLAKQLLGAYGIPVCREALAHSAEEAVEAARRIGFPVAVKVCDSDILHKSEQGLVRVNVGDANGVSQSFSDFQKKAGRRVPVIISEMITGGRELLAGITFDEQFGHCIAFGMGGVLTEAINDVVYRLAPLSLDEAEEMICDLSHPKLLAAYRGMPAVNMKSLAGMLCRLSLIPMIHPEIKEIDINPVVISGAEPVGVDALIIL